MTSLTKLKSIWLIFFIVAATILSYSHFKSESNDSKYYTELVVRHQNTSLKEMIAPKWGENYWGFDPNSYMTDQFPGQLFLGVALSKLGIPPTQSLHILGLAFQILSFFLLFLIAQEFLAEDQAIVLVYTLLIVPLSFSYNIRANHELGIMFFSFLALYSGLKVSLYYRWIALSAIATVFLLIIKGPFFIFGPLLFLIGFLCSPKNKNYKLFLFTLFLQALAVFVVAYLFDKIFTSITGMSFIESFWKIQIQNRAMVVNKTHAFIIQKGINLYYYLSHMIAYSLPWFVLLVVSLINKLFRKNLFHFLKSKISLCFLFSAFIFLAVFSLSDRTAGRYVFPSYYLFSAWTVLALTQNSTYYLKLHEQLRSKKWFPAAVPTIWLITVVLHFI